MLCSLVILAKGVNITNYIACAIMTVIVCSIIVNVSIKKPVKIAMKVSPIEAVRVMITDNLKTTVQNKYRKFTPISLGIMNFKREPKKVWSVVISLSLGGIILLAVSSALLLQSPERWHNTILVMSIINYILTQIKSIRNYCIQEIHLMKI